MIINVTELLKETGKDADLDFTEKASYPDDGLIMTSPVDVHVHLMNSGQGILVTGQIEGEAQLTCCRCLTPFRQTLVAELHERYIQTVPGEPAGADDDPETAEIELEDSDFVSPMENETEINLAEPMRQSLLMAVPMKPLCRPDCPGIPEGRAYKAPSSDPRWDKLKDLKNKL